jgi:hypothetical protein
MIKITPEIQAAKKKKPPNFIKLNSCKTIEIRKETIDTLSSMAFSLFE